MQLMETASTQVLIAKPKALTTVKINSTELKLVRTHETTTATCQTKSISSYSLNNPIGAKK